MKIAVVGAGAMGSVYAAYLAAAGNEVWACDTWKDHVEAIRENGLVVDGPAGRRTVTALKATTDPGEAGACDLYIIATKASGAAAAASAIAACADPRAPVLTIQNGLGALERISRHIDPASVLLGVAEGFGASVVAPGVVHHNAMKRIRLGEPAGGMSDRLHKIVSVWRQAGFNVKAYEDINQLIWEKFVCNVAFSAPCTAFGCTIGELMATPDRWSIASACASEAHAVGLASGVTFSFDDPAVYVSEFGRAMPDARPSMLLDHMAGRRSEIDAINSMVVVLGKQLGIATPYNETLSAVVRAREARFKTST